MAQRGEYTWGGEGIVPDRCSCRAIDDAPPKKILRKSLPRKGLGGETAIRKVLAVSIATLFFFNNRVPHSPPGKLPPFPLERPSIACA